jgi:hypothetical protein
MSKLSESCANIQVVLRLKPPSDEHEPGCVTINGAADIVLADSTVHQAEENIFKFDQVYTAKSTQAELFEKEIKSLLESSVFSGVNATVFAFGATGTVGSLRWCGVLIYSPLLHC